MTLDELKAQTRPNISGCWEWQGRRHNPGGYGRVGHRYAHRLMYEATVGPIPRGLVIRHACDNPPCINPAHLLVGTHADNMRDMAERMRSPKRQQTECVNGHAYDEANTYIRPNGYRDCMECMRNRRRACRIRARAEGRRVT